MWFVKMLAQWLSQTTQCHNLEHSCCSAWNPCALPSAKALPVKPDSWVVTHGCCVGLCSVQAAHLNFFSFGKCSLTFILQSEVDLWEVLRQCCLFLSCQREDMLWSKNKYNVSLFKNGKTDFTQLFHQVDHMSLGLESVYQGQTDQQSSICNTHCPEGNVNSYFSPNRACSRVLFNLSYMSSLFDSHLVVSLCAFPLEYMLFNDRN